MKSFVVVIPSYNNARWYRQNLDSVLNQDYPQFRVIYIDDVSTDDTAQLVAEHLSQHPEAHRVEFVQNQVRVGPLANTDKAIRSCDPNEVVVLVDGDDFLAHLGVLTRLNIIYQDPEVWLTWGQFARFPPEEQAGFCSAIPSEVVSANAYRDFPFVSSHLRTFYAGLYHRIRLVDLQNSEGKFYTIAGDVAQMFALHEMAGSHGRFVAEILYQYNRANPLNDDKLDRGKQIRTENEIRRKARYGRVASPIGGTAPREVCIVSGSGPSLFGEPGPLVDPEHSQRPFRQLRSVLNRVGYKVRETQTLKEIEDPHVIVIFDVQPEELDRLSAYPKDMLNLVLWKDPVSNPANFQAVYHQPFQRIYTWRSDLVDNIRYFQFHFPVLRPMIAKLVPFEQRKLCALISTSQQSDNRDELHSEEREIAAFFTRAKPDSFDLFGSGVGSSPRDYQSVAASKVECLSRYRFSFCYESVTNWKGLVTGKIFDSFSAGCVPVYRGAPDIASEIPADCFIAREAFASEAELCAFLDEMPADVHAGYINRIRAFLSSDAAVPFSAEHFVRTFVGLARGRTTSRNVVSNSSKSIAPASQHGAAAATEGLRERD